LNLNVVFSSLFGDTILCYVNYVVELMFQRASLSHSICPSVSRLSVTLMVMHVQTVQDLEVCFAPATE